MLYYDFIINLKLDLKFVKIGYYIVLALFSVGQLFGIHRASSLKVRIIRNLLD